MFLLASLVAVIASILVVVLTIRFSTVDMREMPLKFKERVQLIIVRKITNVFFGVDGFEKEVR
jgi:hypothetical protein